MIATTEISRRTLLTGIAVATLPFPVAESRSLSSSPLLPPRADRRQHSYSRHGYTIQDPYFWLKDEAYPNVSDPDVLAYLKAENAYFAAMMAPHEVLVDTLFAEMKARLKEDESSVPQKDGGFEYWWAFAPGAQYRSWHRRSAGSDGDVLILDENTEAVGKDYFKLGTIEVSPDGALAAWSADTSGAERFVLKIRDLASGRDLETVTANANGNVVWSSDSKALIYTEVNDNWRSYRACLHRLGSAPGSDRTLYEEQDEGFQVAVGRTQDRKWIQIATGDNETTEVYVLPADDPAAPARMIRPRKKGQQYSIDSAHSCFWILTNDDHINFRVARADWSNSAEWETVIAGSDNAYLRSLASFADHLLISERVDGLDQIRLRNYDGQEHRIAFPEASYTASPGDNPDYAPKLYRLGYSSMITPNTVYDYDPATRQLISRKVQQVPSGYDASRYATERLMVPARDGKMIPVSIVYPNGFARDGSGKLFLYAYGAYGIAIPPSFSTVRLSLLDRGYAYAIAHIRGGDDLGYDWYLQGKTTQRWNTFHDFSDTAKGLIAARFTSAGKIAINGGSAGGELMGVVTNTNPELWGAVVADVPFVDVLNTMQDESLPLTPGEWPEWGNPIVDKAAFELLRSYSPYDNIAAKPYPPIFITGGLNDPRVTYWEPAKWAAKLRAAKTDSNILLLKINMGAGHGGKSGRYDSLREDAEAYAFVLWQMGDA